MQEMEPEVDPKRQVECEQEGWREDRVQGREDGEVSGWLHVARGHPPPLAWNSPLPSTLPRRTPDPHPGE